MIWLTVLTIGLTVTSSNSASTQDNLQYSDELKQKNLETAITSFTVNFGKLLNQDSKPESNLLFSPLNLYSALLLVHLGAAGSTQDEITEALKIPSSSSLTKQKRASPLRRSVAETPQQQFHQYFSNVLNKIQDSGTTNVTIGNAIFAQNGIKVLDEFLKKAENLYDAEFANVNFQTGPAETLKTVNDWISNKTQGRVPELFKESFSSDTIAVLASTLYYGSRWLHKFQKHKTNKEKFNTGSTKIDVEMMDDQQWIPYSSNSSLHYDVIAVPYEERKFSMYIVLPHALQTVANLYSQLKPEDLLHIITNTTEKSEVHYKIPKSKFEWRKELVAKLNALGIKKLFDDADLTGMTAVKNIYVSKVTHAAEIEVDEAGTVATAVTTFEFATKSILVRDPKAKIIEFFVNKPYLFYIVHEETKVILFSGVVYKP